MELQACVRICGKMEFYDIPFAACLERSTPPGRELHSGKKHRCYCFPLRASLFNMFEVDNVNEEREFIFSFIQPDIKMSK